MLRDRRKSPPSVDQDRHAVLDGELEDRRKTFVVESKCLCPGMELDPLRAEVEATARLLDGPFREVETHEWDELPSEAAVRETTEETNIESALQVGPQLGNVDYFVGEGVNRYLKRVRYFSLVATTAVQLGRIPDRTRERRWINRDELQGIPLPRANQIQGADSDILISAIQDFRFLITPSVSCKSRLVKPTVICGK